MPCFDAVDIVLSA